MRVLDRKLIRDLGRLWAQSLAVALVMACGVATLILAIGTYRSLEETRSAYYDRYRFGDIFASAVRAPKALVGDIAAVPGVAVAEAGIKETFLIDIEGMREPASGVAISLPPGNDPAVNALYLRDGRLPEVARANEVAVNANFADAHGFGVGSRFEGQFGAKRVMLTIVGIVLSPEYVYAIGPGDMMPDNRRFGVVWMPEETLASLYDLDGAFNAVSLILLPGANEAAVIDEVDRLLDRYGGVGAVARKDQLSNAFIEGELTQLKGMATIIPPIFLLVSAFLINMILSRLIALEREQIGLLKALGYGRLEVVWHYLKLVLVIAAVGILIGSVAGTWLGRGMTVQYAKFYSFPFLIFRMSPQVYLLAAAVTLFAAMLGAFGSVRAAFALPAAVAMRPPAPATYRRLFEGAFERLQALLPAHHHGDPPSHPPPDSVRPHGGRHGSGDRSGRDGDGHHRLDRLHGRRDLLPYRPAGRDDPLCCRTIGFGPAVGSAASGRDVGGALSRSPGDPVERPVFPKGGHHGQVSRRWT